MYLNRTNVLILAGGLVTRLSEETHDKPKPMVQIGDYPILKHLIDIFCLQGFSQFVVATGYMSYVIEEWAEKANSYPVGTYFSSKFIKPEIVCLDTGIDTQTGGRIKHALEFLKNQRIIATYGDGLGNVNLESLVNYHISSRKLATVTAVHPPARFGYLKFTEDGLVTHFGEKNQADSGWINGGFFVLEPEVKNFIDDYSEPFESGALPRLVSKKELGSYLHDGFWQPIDTLREKKELDSFASINPPPWLKNI